MTLSDSEIKQKLVELAPWHMDMPLPDGSSTADGNRSSYENCDHQEITVITTDEMKKQIVSLYPAGLHGKSFLDVGCNAGAYCFLANELGADFAYGFDVREHWINQAKFVADAWEFPEEKVKFRTHHLHELDGTKKFDITVFKGVFYHLPDPIHALKTLADITNETIILDTGCRNDIPEDCLVVAFESATHLMSGVDKLCWYPGGPNVLEKLLNWCGFEYFATIDWVKENRFNERRPIANKLTNHGRIRVVASCKEEVVEPFRSPRIAEDNREGVRA